MDHGVYRRHTRMTS